MQLSHSFTFTHLADTFIQSDLQCIQVIHVLSLWLYTFKFQNGRKDIVKVIHVTPVLTQFYEAMQVCPKKKKNLPLIYKNIDL